MTEVEAAMLFLSHNKKFVLQNIRNVMQKNYEIVENGNEKIHDWYFDSTDKKLKAQKIQLRVRILGNRVYKVTLKVLKGKTENYSNRIEIERFWSREAFNEITNNLAIVNLRLRYNKQSFDDDPIITFNNLGLIIIQNRETNREIVNAVDEITGQIEFEFDVDSTTIQLNSNDRIQFSELEVESKSGNEKKLDKIVTELLKFPQFIPWSHSKLETGMAVTKLFKKKLLEPKNDYDEKNELTTNGIRKISDLLKNRSH